MIVDSTVTFEEFKEMVEEGYYMEFNDDAKMISVSMKNSEDSIFISPKDMSFYSYFKDYYISNYLESQCLFKTYADMNLFKSVFRNEIIINAIEKVVFHTEIHIENEYDNDNELGQIPSNYKIRKNGKSSYQTPESNTSIFQIIVTLNNGMRFSYCNKFSNYYEIYSCKGKFNPFKKEYFIKHKTNKFLEYNMTIFDETKNELETLLKDRFIFVETEKNKNDFSIDKIYESRIILNPSNSIKESCVVSKMI